MENSGKSSNTKELNGQRDDARAPTREPEFTPSSQAGIQTEHPDSPGKRRRQLILAILLGVGAIAAAIFGYRWWRYASTHVETDDAYLTGHIHQVNSKISDMATKVLVDDNQLVYQGQLLVQLDPNDYQVQIQQAQADLEAARRQASAAKANIGVVSTQAQGQITQAQGNIDAAVATISTAQARVVEVQAGITSAQAQYDQARANLQKTKADYIRYTKLTQLGVTPRQQLDTSKAAYDEALAQQKQATEAIRQAEAKLTQAQKDVANAQAKLVIQKGGLQQAQATTQQTKVNKSQYEAAVAAIAQAQAKLKTAQIQLSYCNITAPIDGRVGNKTVEVGNRVQSGQALMAIVDPQPWIVANFKETQLEQMRPGQRVEIKIDAFRHRSFWGRVDSIAPASGARFALLPPDNATGNFTKIVQRIPVKIVFDPQSIQGYESLIVPGMSTVVSVEHP